MRLDWNEVVRQVVGREDALKSHIKITPLIIILFLVDHMESVDTYPTTLPLPTSITTLTPPTPTLIPRRTLSPVQEKQALIRKIEALSQSNDCLEQKQASLQGTIYDLRKLLAIVGKESSEETQYLHSRNKELKIKADRLSQGLKYSYKNGKHLQRCAQFWNQFLQQ